MKPTRKSFRHFAPSLGTCLILLGAFSGRAQTWFSLQQGDLRTGSDSATVNTSGTVLSTTYETGGTYLRGYTSKNLNFNGDTNLMFGTRNFGTATDFDSLRMLLSFDLTPVANYIGNYAYTIDAVSLITTHRTAGVGSTSSMEMRNTTAFDEATATWNNPGAGAPAGGTLGSIITSRGLLGTSLLYPATQVWTGGALTSAIQNALANSTNKSAYFMFKRASEGDADYATTYVTDENTDPAFGGVDSRPELQVKVTILSNAPLVTISATDPSASEPGDDTGTFTITRSVNTTNQLTVFFNYTGSATPWTDYTPSVTGSVVLEPGVTSTNITVTPINDSDPEDWETINVTIAANANYGIGVSTATVTLSDDNDGGSLVQYFFGNTFAAQVWNTNVTAPAATTPGLAYTYSSGQAALSPPASFFALNTLTSASKAGALANGDYISVSVSPTLGKIANLTSVEVSAIYYNTASVLANEAVLFVRSSLDGFTNDLAILTNLAFNLGGSWQVLNVPLGPEFANRTGPVEFRFYIYDDVDDSTDAALRLDNLYIRGDTADLPVGAQQVALAVTDGAAAEPSDSASFTLTRGGSTAAALEVAYAVSGTASNGVDYAALSGVVSIPAGAASVVLPINVIDDLLQEPTETVTITLLQTNGTYSIFGTNSGTITLADNAEPTQVAVAAGDDNAYERLSTLLGWFNLVRGGDTNTAMTVNFSLTGDAVSGVDYLSSVTNSIDFAAGDLIKRVYITAINDSAVEPVENVQLTILPGTGYITPGQSNALVTITSDDLAPETVWFSDAFETANSSTNYVVQEAGSDGVADSLIDYSFDYSTIGVPPAPGSVTTRGLKLSANKVAPYKSAVVNLFPIGLVASNDFAVRFDLYTQWNRTNDFAEFAQVGINHSGSVTNWRNQSPPLFIDGDGQYVNISNHDRDNPGIVTLYGFATLTNQASQLTNRGVLTLSGLFNNPPYGSIVSGTNGTPACEVYSTTKTWVQCELRQVGDLVEFVMNGLPVVTITNHSAYTNGQVMIGYVDPFDSRSPDDNFALFDNLRVVALTGAPAVAPFISGITVNGTVVSLAFTGAASDSAATFKVQSSTTATGGFNDENSAIITGSGGQFQAVLDVNGPTRFYRIRRN